ncbi:MAG: rhodanese-like domain-containing protein [Chitinophagales bacterium]
MRYLFLVTLIALFSCKPAPKQAETQEIKQEVKAEGKVEVLSNDAFQKKMDELKENNVEFTLLDVRTPAELKNDGYLENAININYNDEDFASQISLLDKEQPLLVYCRSGGRSGKSCAMLNDLGFKEVYDLQGGILGWKDAGNAVITE